MSAAREQETISIQSKFVTEIILYIFTIGILHEKVPISLGHRMILRDMGNHMDAPSSISQVWLTIMSLSSSISGHSVVMLCRFPRLE